MDIKGSAFSVKLTDTSYSLLERMLETTGVNSFIYPSAKHKGSSILFVGTISDLIYELRESSISYTENFYAGEPKKEDDILDNFIRLVDTMRDILPLNTTVCGFRMNRYSLEYSLIAPCSHEHKRIIIASSNKATYETLKSCLITANLYIKEFSSLPTPLLVLDDTAYVVESSFVIETDSFAKLDARGLINEKIVDLSILRNTQIEHEGFKTSIPVGYGLPLFSNLEWENNDIYSVVALGLIRNDDDIIKVTETNYNIQIRHLIDFDDNKNRTELQFMSNWEPAIIGSFKKFNLLESLNNKANIEVFTDEASLIDFIGVSVIHDYIKYLDTPFYQLVENPVYVSSKDLNNHIEYLKKYLGVHNFQSFVKH
jgi:hypothetical protein